jgi:hypothetical protein
MDSTRRTPRYPFGAPAEVFVEDSSAMQLCRVKELSLYGCYLDSAVPLAAKTRVLLKVYGPHDLFEANATVIYTHPMLGMGLVFREVRESFAPVLQKWLDEAATRDSPS